MRYVERAWYYGHPDMRLNPLQITYAKIYLKIIELKEKKTELKEKKSTKVKPKIKASNQGSNEKKGI